MYSNLQRSLIPVSFSDELKKYGLSCLSYLYLLLSCSCSPDSLSFLYPWGLRNSGACILYCPTLPNNPKSGLISLINLSISVVIPSPKFWNPLSNVDPAVSRSFIILKNPPISGAIRKFPKCCLPRYYSIGILSSVTDSFPLIFCVSLQMMNRWS